MNSIEKNFYKTFGIELKENILTPDKLLELICLCARTYVFPFLISPRAVDYKNMKNYLLKHYIQHKDKFNKEEVLQIINKEEVE